MRRKGEREVSARPEGNDIYCYMELNEIYSLFRKCASVATDSRAIKGGEMFVGLKGENFDGNDYALKALEAGAAYAVVDKSSAIASQASSLPESGRIITVDDTLAFLWDLARLHRRSVRAGGSPVVVLGITGTNGKTTTKELVRAVLSIEFSVIATEGNYNNSIGVPLTLLRINENTPFAIVEMGASHPEDIRDLARIAEPDYGIITNVGKGHLLGFGSFDGVKAAKEELYNYIDERNSQHRSFPGKIFVNHDNPVLMELASHHPDLVQIFYGVKYQSAKVLDVDAEHPYLRLQLANGRTVETRLVGGYNADNVLAALKIGQFFGVNESEALAAISAYVPSNNRSQLVHTERNTLIVDAYNANPSSMNAALDNFMSLPADRKAVMLGEMRELGTESAVEHAAVLRRIAESLSVGALSGAYIVGAEFKAAAAGLSLPENCRFYDSVEALMSGISAGEHISGATILIKGSHGNRMDKLIPVL